MAEAVRRAGSPSMGGDAIMEAIAFAAEQLLLAADWRDAAVDVLARLGAAADVSRVYVLENHLDERDRICTTQVAEWCAPGIEPQMGASFLSAAPWTQLPRWADVHESGGTIAGLVRELPPQERPVLEAQGILSILEIPIFLEGAWWGCVGLDDCVRERDWSGADQDALRALAGVLGAALVRQRADGARREAEARYRQLMERIPAVTYTDVPQADVVHMGFVSPQIEGVLGYPPERFTEDPRFWASLMHPTDFAGLDATGAFDPADTTPFDHEYRMRAADGRTVWVHDNSMPVLRPDGTVEYFLGFMTDITERKRVEEQVRAAEERYRALVEHIPAVVYAEAIDANAEDFYVSPQVERVFGYTPEEWRWTPNFWIDHIHPDDRASTLAANEAANRTGDPYRSEYRLRATDGRWVWVHDEAARVLDEDGQPLFWQGVLVDITRTKNAESQLREAEARYRVLVEHIPAVVYTESPDADPAKFYISPQVGTVFGYTPREWTWTPDFWIDRIHPDDRAEALARDERANQTREPYAGEFRFLSADGRWVWVRDEASFVPEPDGEGFWQGFMLDITQRKEAEEQVREAELKFRTIVEQNQAIFYTQAIDPDDPSISRTTYIAPGNTDMLGYTLDEVMADPTLWRAITHPDDQERVFAADAESNQGKSDDHFSLEYRMIAKDGRIVWVQDEAVLVHLPGKAPYWQGFLLDITERKDAEEQLERALSVEREASHRLRALDEMKNTFLQAVSHDLRTPLAAILGLAITLERGDVHLAEDDARDLAHRIASNARRLDRLVVNLLDLDRLARGIVAPQLLPTDAGDLVGRILDESDLIPATRLVRDIQPVVVPLDAAKVERIVENLLANTARHTPSHANVWISVRPVTAPDGVVIAVEDDGPGVPEELREAIFEPFRQGPEAPQHSPGVGVGLTLVQRFAEIHGGRAWVEARDGGGASFRVFLPFAPPRALDVVDERA